MRLTWTPEKDGSIILRDEGGAARAHVGNGKNGWVGHLLEAWTWQDGKMQPPGCGPFRTRYDTAIEIQRLAQKHKLFDTYEFSAIPMREGEHNADQNHVCGTVDKSP